MTPERWRQVDDLFHLALEREAGLRAAFLAQVCEGDHPLRKEVESLLSFHEQAQSFIETPASDLAAELLARKHRLRAGQNIGHYRITGLLGAGGMGEVYLTEDLRLGRRIALKLLPARFTNDRDRLRRFQQEARAASALNHPNILTVHEIELDGDLRYIATEFIDGQTLTQQMAHGPMHLSQTLDVAIQVASALDAAHAAGIVHRDIKPENVMLRTDGYVKVLDFGLAKLTEAPAIEIESEEAAQSAITTTPGIVMGTPRYMSPEQARGLEVDSRTDIFSLGVMIYEMVAGRAPFDGATTSDVIAAILKDEPQPLTRYAPEAPVELERVVKRALAKDRGDRYPTARELSGDLQRLKEGIALNAKLGSLAPAATRQNATDLAFDEKETQVETQQVESRTPPSIVMTESLTGVMARHWRTVGLGSLLVVVSAIAIISIVPGKRTKEEALPPNIRQLTFRSGFITSARFGPDGKTVVYSAGFDGEPMELFTTDLRGSESRPIKIGPAGIKCVSSAGDMAVLLNPQLNWSISSNGTLAVVPLAGGTPRRLMDGVDEADWAPDGKTLAIVRKEAGAHQLEYPVGDVLYRSSGWISHARLSPQGDKVAFLEHPIGNNSGSVAVLDLTTKNTSLVSTGWKGVQGLAWSPAGDEIWFSGNRVSRKSNIHAVTVSGRERIVYEGQAVFMLYDISSEGRVLGVIGNFHTRMVVLSGDPTKEEAVTPFAWSTSADLSADGKTLLFYEWGNGVDAASVYVRKLDGSETVRLGEGRALALSPEGKWALAVRETSPPQLVLLPTGGGEPRTMPNLGIREYHYASWFPDGRQVLFTALGTEDDAFLRSYVLDTESGETRPLMLMDEGMVALRVSPDGKRVVAWSPEGRYYVVPLDGTVPTRIPGLESDEEEPIQWSADGRALYVRGPSDFKTEVHRVEIASGRRRLWKKIVPSNSVGLIGLEAKPGGILITPDGRSCVYTYWTTLQELVLIEGLQ